MKKMSVFILLSFCFLCINSFYAHNRLFNSTNRGDILEVPDSLGHVVGSTWYNDYTYYWWNIESTSYFQIIDGEKYKVQLWKGNYKLFNWGTGAEIILYKKTPKYKLNRHDGYYWKSEDIESRMEFRIYRKNTEYEIEDYLSKGIEVLSRSTGAKNREWWIAALAKYNKSHLDPWEIVMLYRVELFWGVIWRLWEGEWAKGDKPPWLGNKTNQFIE